MGERIHIDESKYILYTERKELKILGYDKEISERQSAELIDLGIIDTLDISANSLVGRKVADRISKVKHVTYPLKHRKTVYELNIDIDTDDIYFRTTNKDNDVAYISDMPVISELISSICGTLSKGKNASLYLEVKCRDISLIDYDVHFVIFRKELMEIECNSVKETIEKLIELCRKGYSIYLVRENRIIYYNK